MPQLRPELPVIDALLSENNSDGGYAHPGGSVAEKEVAWRAWDETVELFRIWFEAPYEGSFEGAFTDMLSARELLALPGKAEALRWVGGDATLDVVGTLDWKSKRYMREPAKEILEVLRWAPELQDEEVKIKIALAELVCYVGYAAAEGQSWGGEVIAYATDNMNVRAWLTSRKAKCALARHLLRILGMLEARWCFRTLSYYIRTYHNLTADWVSRESKEVVEAELEKGGWTKVYPVEGWGLYLVDALKGVFRWPGDRGGSGLQVRRAREGEAVYQAVEGRGVSIEVGEGWHPWGYAWRRLGGDLRMLKSGGRPFWEALETSLDYGCKIWQGEEVIWVFASVGQDLWMGSRKTLLDAVEKCAPMGVMVDVPSSGPKDGIAADLRKRGYEIGLWRIRCTDYGDGVAKVKWVIVGVRNAGEVSGWQLPAATATEPNGVAKLVKSGHKTGEWLDDGWDVCLSRRISTSGERMLPWPAGHAWPRGEKAKKMLVYDIRGPSLTPRLTARRLVRTRESAGCQWMRNGCSMEARQRPTLSSDRQEALRLISRMRSCARCRRGAHMPWSVGPKGTVRRQRRIR